MKPLLIGCLCSLLVFSAPAQSELDRCNITWTTQSSHSAESMPCGGGDIGANVWVEKGEIYLYLSQSGMFDENNALLKAGRIRLRLSPNPFEGKSFRQELVLKDGYIKINGSNGGLSTAINVWVDVFNPVVHIDINSNRKTSATVSYESWRFKDRPMAGKENNANSWKWAPKTKVITRKDSISNTDNQVVFFHQNTDSTVFDATVRLESLYHVKDQLFNPLKGLVFGGLLQGAQMQHAGTYEGTYAGTAFKGWTLRSRSSQKAHTIDVVLLTDYTTSIPAWTEKIKMLASQTALTRAAAEQQTRNWWRQYWDRSFIYIHPTKTDSSESWQVGRNYQLFRYMLGCNAFGKYPTKFNGGLFTYDPVFTDSSIHGTPDHRNWGGGTFTAQNQRLVYWPMLKSGDVDLMKSQFDFYLRLLQNAQLRATIYWGHTGAAFTEQLENFGLPNITEYGWKRPLFFDKGVEYNAWLEYTWDTVLEFCMMILDTELYAGKDISTYIPLIAHCLVFFDEHYQWLAKQRGSKALDGNGHLVLYPGSGAETFKMAYNASSTIAGLQTVTQALLQSHYLSEEKKPYFKAFLKRIPPISFRCFDEHTTLSPAQSWERVNNTESPQLYPVFPWGIYGIGKPGLDTAINTWKYDTLAVKFRSAIGWKQDNIFAARLGLTAEAWQLTLAKLKDSGRRFPAFWGPGFDWVPDHNWGGSGMIGLQEMLLQTDDKKIWLFPAWPKNLDVHFKLHAPYQTTVEAVIKNGQLEMLQVLPKEREKDVVNLF